MNLQFYLERLRSSDEFKKFMKENPKSYLCGGFFVIDKEGKDNKQHFDFYIPSSKDGKKVFSFQLEEKNRIVPVELIKEAIPEKITLKNDFDFDDIEKMIAEKMKKENITNEIQKILLSLQNVKKKNFLVGTVFVSNLGLIKINIGLDDMKIIDFEKKSFFDMMKVVRK